MKKFSRINRKALLLLGIITVIMVVLLTGCVPGDGTYTTEKPAGFLWGIWHGWIAPVSLVIGLFDHGIRVYEPLNKGWWYDFGFYIAIIGGFGGLSLFRKKSSGDKK
ncbi:MAG: hypothetical protein HGA22_10615 [Clostridiales bacterium]|nr:hypothetical protein [Clostridiales bacterium]